MSKIYLIVSTQNQRQNIEELTSVYDYFDGICAVDHFSNDGTYEVLKERCKNGFVEQIPYYGHHSHDLNHIIFNPKIKLSDWCLLRDSAERVNLDFASNIYSFIKILEKNNINTVYQYSKLLMFKRFSHQYFMGTPHWGFHGARNNAISIEKTGWFQDEKEYCYNVRNQRPLFSWIDHYMRYYLILDSNHNLLGAENFGDPMKIFQEKDEIRMQFLLFLQLQNIEASVESIKNYILNNSLTEKWKWFINNVRILNDFYRYWKLNDTDLTDDIKRPIKLIK